MALQKIPAWEKNMHFPTFQSHFPFLAFWPQVFFFFWLFLFSMIYLVSLWFFTIWVAQLYIQSCMFVTWLDDQYTSMSPMSFDFFLSQTLKSLQPHTQSKSVSFPEWWPVWDSSININAILKLVPQMYLSFVHLHLIKCLFYSQYS